MFLFFFRPHIYLNKYVEFIFMVYYIPNFYVRTHIMFICYNNKIKLIGTESGSEYLASIKS